MKRRSFLRHFSHAMAVPGVIGTMGFQMPGANSLSSLLRMAADSDRVLVLIYLEGGNDGLNTVIPLDQLSKLNTARPHVILPDNSLLYLKDSEVALHPALSGLQSLYNESRLQVIQNVGYPEQNYSHFRSTDIWMSGSDADVLVNSGWTGRYLGESFPGYPDAFPNVDMPDPLAIEMGYGSSLIFQGATASMSMVIADPTSFYALVQNEEEPAPDTPAGEKLRYVRLIARQSQQYGAIVKEAALKVNSQKTFPDSSLGQQLKIVSRLIAGGLKTPMYLVRIGGFDTHDAQVLASDHTKGEHAELLQDVNDSIMAFMSDLEMQGTEDRVLGMTFSEFGRRIISNASLGTDHGAAAPMFVFGNAVKGGVLGKNPVIPASANYDSNLEWEYDFRQVYASVLSQWLGADSSLVNSTTLGQFEQVPIIGGKEILGNGVSGSGQFSVYPNPLNGQATITLKNQTGPVRIEVFDMQGRAIERIFEGELSKVTQVNWETHRLPVGLYVVTVHSKSGRHSQKVVKLR